MKTNIFGTTSAYAENTGFSDTPDELSGNYLRVRGEYNRMGSFFGKVTELPPRTRRIRHSTPESCRHTGTTSAYAENTVAGRPEPAGRRNYLRVRGEYLVG